MRLAREHVAIGHLFVRERVVHLHLHLAAAREQRRLDQLIMHQEEDSDCKAKTYAIHNELLANKDVDAVLIATPDHWHAQIAVDACNAGKAVYCEKPLTYTWQEGHNIIKAVNANKTVFQVGLQQRSGTHYAEAKRAFFDSGKIGKVTDG